jgi:hypothetical protein
MGTRQIGINTLLTSTNSSKIRADRFGKEYFWVKVKLFRNVRADAFVVRSFDDL